MAKFNSNNIEGLELALKENSGDNKSLGKLTVSMNNVKFLSELDIVYNKESKGHPFLGILTQEGYIKPYSILYGNNLPNYNDINYFEYYKIFIRHAIEDKAQAIYYSSGGYGPYDLMKSLILAGKNNIGFISIPTDISLYSTDRKNINTCEVEKKGNILTWINEGVFSKNGELIYTCTNFFNPLSLNLKLDYYYKKGRNSELIDLQKYYLQAFWENHCTP